MSFKDKHPIGSEGWFKGEEQFGARGSIATCIQLLLQEEISFAKCMELLKVAFNPFDKNINFNLSTFDGFPSAPWGNLDWNADTPTKEDIVKLEKMLENT